MLEITQTSSLEKILPKRKIKVSQFRKFSCLKNEKFSYQIAYCESGLSKTYDIEITSDISEHILIYDVGLVPVNYPTNPLAENDDNYISKEPGIFPDPLYENKSKKISAAPFYKSLWVMVDSTAPAGSHEIVVKFSNAGCDAVSSRFELTVLPVSLPPQELIYTQWFHTDCLSSYYNYPAFSELHWEIIEKFIRTAAEYGVNMLLTPIFTPALDTQIGCERPTVQLCQIEKDGDIYKFDFSLLKRWIDLCRKCGIKYFEMAHLFTQWGAECTPKIIVTVNGAEEHLFGWHVGATDKTYEDFLAQFLPALTGFLHDEGIAENTYFHISDEPYDENLGSYLKAKELAIKYLDGFKVIDALSSYEFYKKGIVQHPIVPIDHIEPFIGKVPSLWGYHCCSQFENVSNRFIAMPAYRTRSIGAQMFKFHVDGFLQWGYNFYYTQFSKRKVNPFLETDSGGKFPAGDAFSVYPGPDGPIPAIALFVFYEAICDLRAMKLLESLIGHTETVGIIERIFGEISFSKCAHSADTILNCRKAINEEIASRTKL